MASPTQWTWVWVNSGSWWWIGNWPPHAKSWLSGKDLDAGRDWGQEEKGMTEDEMAGWHHQLDGHGFGGTPGVGDGQGGLKCCDSWGWKELDTTERLNWTEIMIISPKGLSAPSKDFHLICCISCFKPYILHLWNKGSANPQGKKLENREQVIWLDKL